MHTHHPGCPEILKRVSAATVKRLCGVRQSRSARTAPAAFRCPARIIVASVFGLLSVCLPALSAADDSETVRELLVPAEQLHLFLSAEAGADRVLLPRSEYEQLLREARKTPAPSPPLDTLANAADIRITIAEERAQIHAVIKLDVLGEGLHAVELPFSGIGLRSAQLDGRAAPLGRADNGALTLFVEGTGRHTLDLHAITPLTTTTASQALAVTLPRLPAATLALTVPGNVELRRGAAVIARRYHEGADETRFKLLPPRSGRLDLAVTLNSRAKRRDRTVIARSVIVDEISRDAERLLQTVSCRVLHRAVDRFDFRVPTGFEITDVHCANLARWELTGTGADRTLRVHLREETTGTVAIQLAAERMRPDLRQWSLPRMRPVDMVTGGTIAGILLDSRLELVEAATEDMTAIENSVLQQALPPADSSGPDRAPADKRLLLAHYAPGETFAMSAQFRHPPAKLHVTSNTLLIIGRDGLDVRGAFTVRPENRACFVLNIPVPEGWRITDILSEQRSPLPFHRHSTPGGGERIRVQLPSPIPTDQEQTVRFEAEHLPDGWFSDWQNHRVHFPRFTLSAADSSHGAVAVRANDDLRVLPHQLDGLLPLREQDKAEYGLDGVDAELAYTYEQTDYAALFSVTRKTPRITAESLSFFRVDTDQIDCRLELLYDIRRASTRALSFSLPADTPQSLSITAISGVAIKESIPKHGEDRRIWTVELTEPIRGLVHLAADFEQRMDPNEKNTFSLPLPTAENVAFQAGLLAVEGNEELDVHVASHPRPVDIGEMVDAHHQPGPRLLGAYEFIGPPPNVIVKASRPPLLALPSTIVQHARLATTLSRDGVSQTAAEYALHSKAATLDIQLPDGAQLWSATLDGRPANPRGSGSSMLVDLDNSTPDDPQILRLVYETPTSALAFLSDMQAAGPLLRLPADGSGPLRSAPVIDTEWRLHTPSGFDVVRSRGPLACQNLPTPTMAAVELPGLLSKLGGNINFNQGLISALVRTPQLALPLIALVAAIVLTIRHMRKKTREGGLRGFLTALLQVGIAVCVLGLLAGMLLPALGTAREKARQVSREHQQKADIQHFSSLDESIIAEEREAAGEAKRELPADDQPRGGGRDGAESARQAEDQAQKGRPTKPATPAWTVDGLRSLSIDLTREGRPAVFTGTGQAPRLHITIWNRDRIDALAWAVAAAVFLAGAAQTGQSTRRKAFYVLAAALLSTALSPLPVLVLLVPVLNAVFWAAALLIPYFVIVPLIVRLFPFLAGGRMPEHSGAHPRAQACLCIWLAATCGILTAQADNGDTPTPVRAEDIRPPTSTILRTEPPLDPIPIPYDAIIIPYDPDADDSLSTADRVFISRSRFQKLWQRAQQSADKTPALPVDTAVAGARFEARLGETDTLELRGTLLIDGYRETPTECLLPIRNAVLTQATLDEAPARIRILNQSVTPENTQNSPAQAENAPEQVQRQQTAQANAGSRSLLAVTIPGKGRHRLEIGLRIQLDRQGGWRIASAILPNAPATAVDLTVPTPDTEVRFRHLPDRKTRQTTKPDQRIETTTAANGRFHTQWRPRISRAKTEHALTVESNATFEVRQESLQLAWHLQLTFRDGERDDFDLSIPDDYRIESVTGENVRGWDVSETDDKRRLAVRLLKPGSNSEAFTVRAWRPHKIVAPDDARPLNVPTVNVEGAVRHLGTLALRASRALELRVLETADVTRLDIDRVEPLETPEAPRGTHTVQAYEFRRVPFRIHLRAAPLQPSATVRARTLLRIAEHERRSETRLQMHIENRPLFTLRIRIPDSLEIDAVEAPGTFEWTSSDTPDGRHLTLRFSDGLLGDVAVVISGQLGERGPVETLSLPRFDVLDIARETGEFAVSSDPAFDVQPTRLDGIEQTLLRSLRSWVPRSQHEHLRLALRYDSPAFDGILTIAPRTPQIQCWTLTNARLTNRALEQSMLLTFTIKRAGIRRLQFQLPEQLADAIIQVPMLSRKTITESETPAWLDVTLHLQDEIMGELRVLVEHDQALPDNRHHLLPPLVKTGTTTRCYLAVENAGRDEVIIDPDDSLTALTPDRREWSTVSNLLRQNASEIHFTPWDESSDDIPSLHFHTKQRETVSTAGARIGLAQTLLAIDDHGFYRGRQSYRVDNQTEQFLIVELPAGANLLSARVAGRLVKAVKPESSRPAPSRVRIPLVKTADGELDYAVVLKYGGRRPLPGGLRTSQFPLLQTVNVDVERSQVELRVPATRQWADFGGTMRKMHSREDLHGYFLEYQTRQAKRLLQTLKFGSEFSQARAYSNVKILNKSLRRNQEAWRQRVQRDSESDLQSRLEESDEVLEQAGKELQRARNQLSRQTETENMQAIRDAYQRQHNQFARNRVLEPNDDSRTSPQEQMKAPKLQSPKRRAESDKKNAERAQYAGRAGQKNAVARYQKRMEKQARQKMDTGGTIQRPGGFSQSGPGGSLRAQTGWDDLQVDGEAISVQETGLASLDFTLPDFDSERWTRHFFTTPRGDIRIQARSISHPTIQRLKRAGIAVAALAIILILHLATKRTISRPSGDAVARFLLALGAAGLLFGILPVYAVLALVIGALCHLTLRIRHLRSGIIEPAALDKKATQEYLDLS